MKPEACLQWILLVSMSPIAILVVILMALLNLFQFLFKSLLLFIIVAIKTPFAVMYNVSIVVIANNLVRFRNQGNSMLQSDQRANVSIEVQVILSDFFKVIASELLVVLSTGIITFFTAPLLVFYISTAVWLVAILHKWLNTDSLSKTALSCLCGGYGLNPMMFLFSFIGLFDIGGHPVAKCSFVAKEAYLFVKDWPNEEDGQNLDNNGNLEVQPFRKKSKNLPNPWTRILPTVVLGQREQGEHRSKGDMDVRLIEFSKWDVFERGLFQLSPSINFITNDGKYILESFMVLKLLHHVICKYPVERLELPEDYSKSDELYNFLVTLSSDNVFVTDKMRGRYELSLTLLEIAEGVEENVGYRIMKPKSVRTSIGFVVAGCTKKSQ